jgi:DNA-binding response OmpR family regulator
VASDPVRIQESIKFGDDCELDPVSYELRRLGRVLKLERIPAEILLFLVEQRGKLVTREQIVDKIWGKGVFLDTDNSINGAMRKIRQALQDDPERPRFIQTITGRGYRFIAPAVGPVPPPPASRW